MISNIVAIFDYRNAKKAIRRVLTQKINIVAEFSVNNAKGMA